MNSFKRISKRIAFVFTAVLAGLCLFIIMGTSSLSKTALDSDYHKQLFEKHDIYTKTHAVINSSINQYFESLMKTSSTDFEQHKEIFILLQESITPEMVRTNLDSIRQGLFQYFNGERKFLPDIYLNTADSQNEKSSVENSVNTTENNPNSPYQALSKIKKINLSAILLYINRSDISDSLFQIKFFSFAISQTPGLFVLVLLLLALIGLYICGRFASAAKWVAVFTLTGGVVSLVSGMGLFFYSYSMLPKTIYPLVISLPLPSEIIISYLRDCIIPIASFLSASGIVLIILSAVVFYSPVLIPLFFKNKQFIAGDRRITGRTNKIIKNTVFAFFCLLLLTALIYRVNVIKYHYDANNFSIAVSKMKNTHTVTQVISAKDEAIYTLHIKLVDKEKGTPIAKTQINVYGRSIVQGRYINETISTDDSGIAKFTLDKGAFRISFDSDSLPMQYQMPTAFYYEMKSPGITIITVNLEEQQKGEQQSWGFGEIEVLDKENKPISGIELTVEGTVSAPGFPSEVFSVTNSEGIAVFKLTPGVYNFSFVKEKFPDKYEAPVPIEANITVDSVSRYTIRLVDVKKNKGMP